MTREQIETYFETWLPRLRLTHWDIFINWDEPPPEGESAITTWAYAYDSAMFRFAPSYDTWTERYAEATVVHELLHLVARDLDVAIDACHSQLSGRARALAKARTDHEMEGVVDRVATVLVALTTTA